MYREIWNREKCRDKILTLRRTLGFLDSSVLKFLRLSLSLEDGQIYDELRERTVQEMEASVYCILSGYADAPRKRKSPTCLFSTITGRSWLSHRFQSTCNSTNEGAFSSFPKTLYKAAELLDATKLEYGDYSVKIYALPLVPVYVVMWNTSSEFPTSANILFDSSVSNYLSTEQIAIRRNYLYQIKAFKRGNNLLKVRFVNSDSWAKTS